MNVDVLCYSMSGMTKRFAERLGLPWTTVDPSVAPRERPFVLITPTYGGDIPAPVKRFLAAGSTHRNLRGVVASGNRNFGADYARAGDLIEERCGVPVLHRFELSGVASDIEAVRAAVDAISASEPAAVSR